MTIELMDYDEDDFYDGVTVGVGAATALQHMAEPTSNCSSERRGHERRSRPPKHEPTVADDEQRGERGDGRGLCSTPRRR